MITDNRWIFFGLCLLFWASERAYSSPIQRPLPNQTGLTLTRLTEFPPLGGAEPWDGHFSPNSHWFAYLRVNLEHPEITELWGIESGAPNKSALLLFSPQQAGRQSNVLSEGRFSPSFTWNWCGSTQILIEVNEMLYLLDLQTEPPSLHLLHARWVQSSRPIVCNDQGTMLLVDQQNEIVQYSLQDRELIDSQVLARAHGDRSLYKRLNHLQQLRYGQLELNPYSHDFVNPALPWSQWSKDGRFYSIYTYGQNGEVLLQLGDVRQSRHATMSLNGCGVPLAMSWTATNFFMYCIDQGLSDGYLYQIEYERLLGRTKVHPIFTPWIDFGGRAERDSHWSFQAWNDQAIASQAIQIIWREPFNIYKSIPKIITTEHRLFWSGAHLGRFGLYERPTKVAVFPYRQPQWTRVDGIGLTPTHLLSVTDIDHQTQDPTLLYLVRIAEGREQHIMSATLTHRGVVRLSPLMGWNEVIVSPNGLYYVAKTSQALSPPKVMLHDRHGRQLALLSAPSTSWHMLSSLEELELELLSESGARLFARLIFQENNNEPQPLLVLLDGREDERMLRRSWGVHVPLIAALVQQGYRVLIAGTSPSIEATETIGFTRLRQRALQIAEVIRYVSRFPHVNQDQVGLLGWGLGSSMSLYLTLATQLDVVSVNIRPLITSKQLPTELYTALFKTPSSSVQHTLFNDEVVHNLSATTAPFFILHGLADQLILPKGSLSLIKASQQALAPLEVMLYPEEGELLTIPKRSLHILKSAMRFFRQHLKKDQ